MINLTFLNTNQAYVFTFGDALLRLYDRNGQACPLFLQSRNHALAAADSCGLRVMPDNSVVPMTQMDKTVKSELNAKTTHRL